MPRQTKPLSVKEIESAKSKEAGYVLCDGGDGVSIPSRQVTFLDS
jgi:hypothetical protein